jgi:hypothetical protein
MRNLSSRSFFTPAARAAYEATWRCLDSRAEREAFERDVRAALLRVTCSAHPSETKRVVFRWKFKNGKHHYRIDCLPKPACCTELDDARGEAIQRCTAPAVKRAS